MGKAGSKVLREAAVDGLQAQSTPPAVVPPPPPPPPPAATVHFQGVTKTKKMKVKWTQVGLVFFLVLSMVMTGCFFWQYQLPKMQPDEGLAGDAKAEMRCPRFPEPVPLQHPIPGLKEALEKVDILLRQSLNPISLPALSAIVILNDTVLWTGNFGKRNSSDAFSGPPNEYTIYRIASLSKIFPTLMLYRLWEDGKIGSLDDPLEKYVDNFTIKNPMGRTRESELKYVTDGLIFLDSGEVPVRSSSVTLRRMASQLSGLPRRLRATNLLWKGKTQSAINLLQDDVLVADPGTKCHYSNLAFSLLAHVMSERVVNVDYQRWVSENILDRLGMEDTGFDITPGLQGQVAVGVYSNGKPAPLYDLGWYRPSGQMFSTAADLAKLAMMLLGAYHRKLLDPDSLKIMLTPLFRCDKDYFANRTGTPWEVNELLGYEMVRKDGDLDGYSATFSLVPRLKLGLVVLMAGGRSQKQDVVAKAYRHIVPAVEKAFREANRVLSAPPNPEAYAGFFTYSNMTFYEIKAGSDGVLTMQQFGPQIEELIPQKYRTIKLNYLVERVFRVVFEREYPCVLRVGSASVSLEAQDGQLFNFYAYDKRGLSPGFDAPGLNTYNVVRISRKPSFSS
ncbi:putative beta-lactamase-like 1 isoform X1 [Phyllopteryx taeniolatus]|uniref:putative beta-lactamase-like 1 isoform X1 n=2 Tax=Phyllopteryx taeniolatus TaxID=161469 RepID=UPI002AD49B5A|nr:putative beta-lactamase-like 1 isoform X1 [Phyllopteryx taeniolatus]XP_061641838.1 putative beta-lactamase-like 1 isoform X1 [Phyllopteryx taeniolatus]XP_061641839.1 putative beta-lactamase-like 1 isoform X1 [Phyllopteryx taeniolatus]XP_061641840.1 putative beta-lactamase-like 1 isoform X1 [Phyllopteryx taeniolatus]